MAHRTMNRRLAFEQKLKLTDLLRTRQEQLRTDRPAFTELADSLTKELGFEVSDKMLAELCPMIGVEWERRITAGGYRKGIFKLYSDKIEALEAELAVVRGLVHHLYLELNARPPHGYVVPHLSKPAIVNGK